MPAVASRTGSSKVSGMVGMRMERDDDADV
jgi:hypothetical protein